MLDYNFGIYYHSLELSFWSSYTPHRVPPPTELAYPKMMQNVRHKTVRWQLLKSLEPPRVVHVRHTDILNKENVFAQVTVRLHTQQVSWLTRRGVKTFPRDARLLSEQPVSPGRHGRAVFPECLLCHNRVRMVTLPDRDTGRSVSLHFQMAVRCF